MKTNIALLIVIIILLIIITGCSNHEDNLQNNGKIISLNIYHLHDVPECFICKLSGEYIEQTLNENFEVELNSGKIIYQDIDKTKPENEYLVKKFDVLKGYSGIYIETHYEYNNYSSFKEYTNIVDLENETLFKESFNEYIKKLFEE